MQRANPTDLKILKRSSNFTVIYAYILKYREYPQTPNSLNQLQYAISPRLTPLSSAWLQRFLRDLAMTPLFEVL